MHGQLCTFMDIYCFVVCSVCSQIANVREVLKVGGRFLVEGRELLFSKRANFSGT